MVLVRFRAFRQACYSKGGFHHRPNPVWLITDHTVQSESQQTVRALPNGLVSSKIRSYATNLSRDWHVRTERAMICSVFTNQLADDMCLQSQLFASLREQFLRSAKDFHLVLAALTHFELKV